MMESSMVPVFALILNIESSTPLLPQVMIIFSDYLRVYFIYLADACIFLKSMLKTEWEEFSLG
jgi:type II secretory pathway component PulF